MKGVALVFLKNDEVSAKLELPHYQDTGTAIVMGKKVRMSRLPCNRHRSGVDDRSCRFPRFYPDR